MTAVATSLEERLPELGAELRDHLLEEIPELQGDEAVEELLGSGAAQVLATVLAALKHGIDVERIDPPAAAAEYARRLAQRNVSLEALLRAFRLGGSMRRMTQAAPSRDSRKRSGASPRPARESR